MDKNKPTWREIVSDEYKIPVTMEEVRKYLKSVFRPKSTPRSTAFCTGRGGAIMQANLFRKYGGLEPMSREQENKYRDGSYMYKNGHFVSFGYPIDKPDGFILQKERGYYYVDQITNGWATQVEEITEEKAQELIKIIKQ